METSKVIEKFLDLKCDGERKAISCCIFCSSQSIFGIKSLISSSVIVSNAACQVVPNLASIYFLIQKFSLSSLAVISSTRFDIDLLVKMAFPSADLEFRSLRKMYEESFEVISTMYEESSPLYRIAFNERNIDLQIDSILSIPEFKDLVSSGKLSVFGLVLDEDKVYGDESEFYLINYAGVKDPADIRALKELEDISESVKKRKVKRMYIQV